ncbi:sulfotransferase domain-containing protein [Acidobacteriota bacterium]
MLLVFSFARSGSTLLLDFLSDLLGFNRVFEPLMREPEKINGHPDFEDVHDWFRGAPREHKLHDYKIGDFYLGHIPETAFNSNQIKLHKEKLKNYLGHIYHYYGENTVIKFVRQQGNIPFFHSIMRELNITPGYILLKRNPYEIAYSYYRMGGFHRRSTWGVNRLFQYRKQMYRGESEQTETMFNHAKNPFDKLIAAILADYRTFDISAGWLRDKGVPVVQLGYEHFIKNTPGCCRRISIMFNIPVSDEAVRKTISRCNINPHKVAAGQTDPLYSYLAQKSRLRMTPYLSQFPPHPPSRTGGGEIKTPACQIVFEECTTLFKSSVRCP